MSGLKLVLLISGALQNKILSISAKTCFAFQYTTHHIFPTNFLEIKIRNLNERFWTLYWFVQGQSLRNFLGMISIHQYIKQKNWRDKRIFAEIKKKPLSLLRFGSFYTSNFILRFQIVIVLSFWQKMGLFSAPNPFDGIVGKFFSFLMFFDRIRSC